MIAMLGPEPVTYMYLQCRSSDHNGLHRENTHLRSFQPVKLKATLSAEY